MCRYRGASLVLMAILAMSPEVLAQKTPSSFWAEELLGAEVGAVIGGAIGLATVHTTCVQFEKSCDPLYRVLVLQQRISFEDPLAVIKLTSPGFHTVNMGRALGALAGVALMGLMRGVEGNIWAAFLATQAWLAGSREFFILKAPLMPALVATVAYNWEAKLKAQKTSPAPSWSFTLIESRF